MQICKVVFISPEKGKKTTLNKRCTEKKLFVTRLKKDQMFSFSHSEVLPGKSLDEIIIFCNIFKCCLKLNHTGFHPRTSESCHVLTCHIIYTHWKTHLFVPPQTCVCVYVCALISNLVSARLASCFFAAI